MSFFFSEMKNYLTQKNLQKRILYIQYAVILRFFRKISEENECKVTEKYKIKVNINRKLIKNEYKVDAM